MDEAAPSRAELMANIDPSAPWGTSVEVDEALALFAQDISRMSGVVLTDAAQPAKRLRKAA